MMKRLILIPIICTWGMTAWGQQLFSHTHNPDFFHSFNPAATNNIYLHLERKHHQLSVFHRKQWIGSGVPGAPVTWGASGNVWLGRQKRLQAGLGYLEDEAGAISYRQFYGRAAIDLLKPHDLRSDFSEKKSRSLHLGVGIHQGRYMLDRKLLDGDPSDLLLQNNGLLDTTALRGSAGLYGHLEIQKGLTLYGGFAIHQVAKVSEYDSGLSEDIRHLFFNLGLLVKLPHKATTSGDNVHFLELSGVAQSMRNIETDWNVYLRYHRYFNERSDWSLNAGLGTNFRSMSTEFFLLYKHKYGLGVNFDFWSVGGDRLLEELQDTNTREVRLVVYL